MIWTDTFEIVDSLIEKHPDINPEILLFTDLMNMVMNLESFEGQKEHCNERVLEAIQSLWIDEKD